MKIFIKIFGILHLSSIVAVGFFSLWGGLVLAIAFISTGMLYYYIIDEDEYNKELLVEKQAYIDAKKNLEVVSILLGNVLIENEKEF